LISSEAKRTIRCVVVERNGQEQLFRIKKGGISKSLRWPTQNMGVMFFQKSILVFLSLSL